MTTPVDKSNTLAARLARYGGEALLMAADIPDKREARHVKDQLTRSATAPGAHYAEARSAQSLRDFIHKVALAAKEARESVHWLEVSLHAQYIKGAGRELVDEGRELTAMLSASLQTARDRTLRDDEEPT